MSRYTTAKSLLNYAISTVSRYTPLTLNGNELNDIVNFRELNTLLYTSGQPREEQLLTVKHSGCKTVINLAPYEGVESALKDEKGTVEGLGMTYIHIPVNFEKPTNNDFKIFCDAMAKVSQEKTLVHCAVNMRASAFVYRYRCEILGEEKSIAEKDMLPIWSPMGIWKQFVVGNVR